MWIEIFRSGTFTDSQGRTQTFTENDLEQMAKIYNERIEKDPSSEAPLVKGHPKDNAPAHGWVERLARRGSVLYAKLKSLSKEIIDEINEGRYRKVSISMYPNFMLRHIGLLGAESPAVKGLRPISFVEFDETVAFDYPAEENVEFAELRQEIRRLEIENSQLARQNEALRDQLQKTLRESLAKSFRQFIKDVNEKSDYLIIPPAREEQFVELLEYCAKVDELLLTSHDESFPENFSILERVKQFISEIKPLPIKREYTLARNESIAFENSFEGKKVDENRLEIHLRAKNLQKENPELSYEQALMIANKGRM